MASFHRIRSVMLAGVACSILSACGADGVASPGEGVIVLPAPTPAPAPAPAPTPAPTPTPPALVTPAAACPNIPGPNQLVDLGTISGPEGTWRNCGFPERFTANTAISRTPGVIYSLPGRVDVGTDQGAASTNVAVTLTIDPGVVIFGGTGVSFLVVNRGNKIDAVGTPQRPIIFTGRGDVVGSATDNTSQLWGGVVLLGRAPVTDCLAPGAAEGTAACERDTEGTSNALGGGAQPADNSGRFSFVQIRYSGFVLSANSELQALTTTGVGSGTEISNIHSHNSSDDGVEFFGGRHNVRNLVVTGAEDDSLDTDVGYKGFIQFVIAVHRAGSAGTTLGDSMIEADSNGNESAVPRQNTRLANFTFVQRAAGSNGASILLRGGTDYHMMNGVISSPTLPCLRMNSATTIQAANAALDDVGPPKFDSVVMQCGGSNPFVGSGGVTAAEVASIFGAGTNVSSTFTTSLTNVYVNGPNETARTPFNASTVNPFFVNTDYIGAVKDANDTRFQGWTCNSATANFGSSSIACTALPTT